MTRKRERHCFVCIVSVLVAASPASAQETVTNRNAAGQVVETYTVVDGKRDGPYASFYGSGAKKAQGTYVKGHLTGQWVEYHANGKPYREATFEDGQLAGTWSQYHDTGQLEAQGETYGCVYHANDASSPRRTGTWTYYDRDGKKRAEGAYEKNNMDGRWTEYHANGKVFRDVTFEDGQLAGTWSQYHDTGQLEAQGETYGCVYHANDASSPRRTGTWTYYDRDGKKRAEGAYEKNNMDGRWTEYHANGKVFRDVTFKGGQLTGTWSRYYDTGQLEIQGETYGCEYHGNDTSSPLRTGLWVSYDRSGKITEASLFEKNRRVGEANYATDPDTGITRVSVPRPDGSRSVVEVDRNGRIGAPEAPPPEAPGPEDAADLVGMQEDPATGEIRTVRRNEDGSTSAYTGVKKVDADGTVRLVETDENGNRIESVFAPDGTVTITKSSPGQGETKTTTTKDGQVLTIHRDVTGETRTSSLAEDGSIMTERRNARGELVETTRDLPDGWTEHLDAHGNSRMVFRDSDGSTTTIVTDRSGNSTTTVVDGNGAVVARESDRIAPREPGRDYFEQVLNGTDWDDLPNHLKTRYAHSERAMREIEARRAEEDAAEARQKVEEARIAAENLAAAEETKRRFEALEAEQEEADRIAAQRRARVERQAEIDRCYETAHQLQRQYDDAVRRGDKAEAMRVLALQDEHHERSMEVLQHTPEESEAMQRYSDARSRLASEITARAHAAAKERMAADESLQDTKEGVTGVTRFVSVGSQMQQATKRTTRGANREKALAQAKQEEIARRLADPATTAEERAILEDIRAVALVQENGAAELLAANSRITAAGYAVDAALVITGGKVVQAGSGVVKSAAGAVSGVLAKRAAARGASAGATAATGEAAGRTTVTLVAEDAGRTLGLTSRMTAAERQALLESRAGASMGEVTRIVGRDVLPGPAAPRTSLEITRSELARLHTPGANLTRTEIMKKAEVYRAMESARAGLRRAVQEGAPDSVVNPLQASYQRLNALIEEAKNAAWATWRSR